MSTAPSHSDNFCYRHPDRQSFVLCQRCGRTICGECQVQAPVGVHCPECVREHQQNMPRRKPAVVTAIRRARTTSGPLVTYSIIALCVVIWLLQQLSGGAVTNALLYFGPYTEFQPWRMVSALFVHSQGSFLHIVFNMYSLWIFGRILEHMLGRWRFLALFLLSGIGGSLAVLLLSPLTPVALPIFLGPAGWEEGRGLAWEDVRIHGVDLRSPQKHQSTRLHLELRLGRGSWVWWREELVLSLSPPFPEPQILHL